MKYSVLFLLVAIMTSQIAAQTYGLGGADFNSFFRYRIPETDLRRISLNTNFNFSSTKNTFSNPSQDVNLINSSLSYTLSPDYYLRKESDDRSLYLRLNLTAEYDRQYYKSENNTVQVSQPNITTYYENERRDNRYKMNLLFNCNYRKYISSTNLYFTANPAVEIDFADSYLTQSSAYLDVSKDKEYTGSKNQYYDLSVGIGWGKYRNVTPIVSAIRFQERLKQLNLLNSNLSDRAIEDLAEQFNRFSYYSEVHDRPQKYFWQDIENVLVKDNIIPIGNLNQYAFAYLQEVPYELRFLRNEGFDTGINIYIRYNNNYSHNPGTSIPPASLITEDLYTLGNLYLDFSHQLDLNSQLGFNILLNAGPNLIKNSHDRQMYQLYSQLSYDHELTDRLVASIKNTVNLIFQNSFSQKKQLTDDLALNINYFIEDNISLLGAYHFIYSEWKGQNEGQFFNTVTNNYINFGLTYFFDRGFLI